MPTPTLRDLREGAGLSQADLAEKAGVPVRCIQNWEQGHRRPRVEPLLQLAAALALPLEQVVAAAQASWRARRKLAAR